MALGKLFAKLKAARCATCDRAGSVRWFLQIGLAHDESAWPRREAGLTGRRKLAHQRMEQDRVQSMLRPKIGKKWPANGTWAGMGATPEGRGAGSGIDTAVDQLMARESPVRVPVRQKKGDGRSDQAMSSRCRQRRSRIGGWWHRMISGSSRFRLLVAQGEAGRLCRCGCGGCVWWWSGGVVGGSTAVSRVG